ncbi:MAG: [Clostridia bacterium]|nr:[FeFe] hydrogenase H-cluster radical SAM maturase HydE [Clostridia bacterium]
MKKLIDKLYKTANLKDEELAFLIDNIDDETLVYLHKKARQKADEIYGKTVYIRGLIEFTNYCKNNCYYCGIRAANKCANRYRLSKEEILECCENGYNLGFHTFVLQGGEDAYFSDDKLCDIVSSIKQKYPDCAITLSVGEREKSSYKRLFDCGADRYLLRHETATKEHYQKLHPENIQFENRFECLNNLKEIGYQTGCGFMVGSPCQTTDNLVNDLRFIKNFQPEMVGIGPFIPHKDTPFSNEKSGSVRLTLILLSIIRLLVPTVLLPSTTALSTADENGYQKGILAGANVIMPNLSPESAREKYTLYNGKKTSGSQDAGELEHLKHITEEIGYKIVFSRGDNIAFQK